MPAQTSANRTAWSTKKSINPPVRAHKVTPKLASARGIMQHKPGACPGSTLGRRQDRDHLLVAAVARMPERRRSVPVRDAGVRAALLDQGPDDLGVLGVAAPEDHGLQ